MDNRILFKYLSASGAEAMLKGSNLQFTNATYFNDPFDCHPKLINCENVPMRSWPPPDFTRSMIETRLENERNRTWISCFSKTKDNLLMWSYYTNHQGVCIGINRDHLAKNLLARYFKGSLGLQTISTGIDVEYRDIINRPDYFSSPVDCFRYQLCTKGRQWEHEQEVRFAIIEPSPMTPYCLNRKPKKKEVVDWKEVRFYPHIGTECFHSIYFGCRMKDEDKETIFNILHKAYPKVSVFQMIVNPDRFCLDAQPIEF